MMVKVKLLKHYGVHNAGETAMFPPHIAKAMVEKKTGVIVPEVSLEPASKTVKTVPSNTVTK